MSKHPSEHSRRDILQLFTAGAALGTMPASAAAKGAKKRTNPLFKHGVASGDPDRNSLVIWTRITLPKPKAAPLAWQVAADEAFANIIQSGTTTAREEADFTAKVLVRGLEAGSTYFYRFSYGGKFSPVGRTRTLPSGDLSRLGIAVVSCSNFPFGYFNVYDAIAKDEAVDFVLHTGDYMYEYGQGEYGWGDDVGKSLGRRHDPPHEIVTLSDYRTRHAQYKTDNGAQAMFARHPFLCIWDDHESANDPWMGGAQNHQSEREGDWNARRAASIQAYYEWLPLREPEWLADAGRTKAQLWRAYSFGNLALLHTLETRHTGRAKQLKFGDYKKDNDADTRKAWMEAINTLERPMISAELEADLRRELSASVEKGQKWRLIGNQIPIARMNIPDLEKLGFVDRATTDPKILEAVKGMLKNGPLNIPLYADCWDGYGWARERLYALSRAAGAGDLIFLTGDSHSFWANQLADNSGVPSGIELGTSSVTSPGDFQTYDVSDAFAAQIDRAIEKQNGEVLWADNMNRGYVRLTLTHAGGVVDYIGVSTVLSENYNAVLLKRFAVSSGNGVVSLEEMTG